jgi:hypothetical protein
MVVPPDIDDFFLMSKCPVKGNFLHGSAKKFAGTRFLADVVLTATLREPGSRTHRY